MALIKCEECGKEISSEALTCPHCGATTAEGKRNKDFQADKKIALVRSISKIAYIVSVCVFIWNIIKIIIEKNESRYAFTSPLSEHESNVVKWLIISIIIMVIASMFTKAKRIDSDATIKYNGAKMNNGVWHCTCGMNNPLNRTSCVSCGRMRDDAPRMSVSQGYWQCMNCGRNNPNYTGTCACGAKKPE